MRSPRLRYRMRLVRVSGKCCSAPALRNGGRREARAMGRCCRDVLNAADSVITYEAAQRPSRIPVPNAFDLKRSRLQTPSTSLRTRFFCRSSLNPRRAIPRSIEHFRTPPLCRIHDTPSRKPQKHRQHGIHVLFHLLVHSSTRDRYVAYAVATRFCDHPLASTPHELPRGPCNTTRDLLAKKSPRESF
jgi:hypothetical protein